MTTIQDLIKQKDELQKQIDDLQSTMPNPRSMKGYKFGKWFDDNKDTIKNLIVAGIAIGVFFLPQLNTPQLSTAVATISGLGTKLLVDGIDYYFSP